MSPVCMGVSKDRGVARIEKRRAAMYRMNNLPENILQALKPYYQPNEVPDVFPSIFLIKNEKYYFFTFAPAAEQLIMKENGSVPAFEEIKQIALIASNYNHSIESIANIGSKWVKAGRTENYEKLIRLLEEIEEKLGPLPDGVRTDVMQLKEAAGKILFHQKEIEEAVQKGAALWDRTNAQALVTEEDQQTMRGYMNELGTAQFKQNEIQIETQEQRERIDQFLSSRKSIFHLKAMSLYNGFKPYKKFMMNSNESIEMENVRQMMENANGPLEQGEGAADFLAHLRNPKQYRS